MTLPDTQPASPRWGSTTKLIVGLTIVAIIAGLVVYFRTIIGPLILAFILAYLLHPVVERMSTATRIPWRTAVNLIYLLFVIVMVGLITLSGLAIVQQVQSLVDFIQENIGRVPEIITALSSQVFRIGPFEVDFKQFDFQALANQLLSSLQALASRAGGLVGTVATSAAGTLGWLLFIMVISYFLLADTGQVSKELVHVEIPGYDQDLRRLSAEIRKIWNTFLRGQIIIIFLVILTYTILMSALGMRFAFGIAILAGLGRLVPYLGPLVLWVVISLVAFFQGSSYFGIAPLHYAALVLIVAVVTDQIFDNLVTPRFFGRTLGVHPAAVLVAAIILARLIGLIGLLLAAPGLATVVLIVRYIIRKMLDLEPFPATAREARPEEPAWSLNTRRLRAWWRTIQRR